MSNLKIGKWEIKNWGYLYEYKDYRISIYHHCNASPTSDQPAIVRVYPGDEDLFEETKLQCNWCDEHVPGIVYVRMCQWALNEFHRDKSWYRRALRWLRRL